MAHRDLRCHLTPSATRPSSRNGFGVGGVSDYSGDHIYCDVIIPRRLDIDVVAETDNVLAFPHRRPLLAISPATGWPIVRLAWNHEDCCSERSQGQAFGISG